LNHVVLLQKVKSHTHLHFCRARGTLYVGKVHISGDWSTGDAFSASDTDYWASGRASSLQKIEWWGAGVVTCLEQGANDMHMEIV